MSAAPGQHPPDPAPADSAAGTALPHPRNTAQGAPESTPNPLDAATSSDTEYEHLEPVLAAYAATAPQEPERARLRERLATGYLPVARNVARRYAGRGEPLEDLTQVGCIGLLKAIDRYDPELGYHFLSFAIPTITGEIRRHFRDKTWSMRVPRRLKDLHVAINPAVVELSAQLHRAPRPSEIAAHLQTSTAEIIEALHAAQAYRPASLEGSLYPTTDATPLADTLGTPEPRYELFTNIHSLAPHLAALPARERNIVIMRFYQDMTQTQIAEKIGVSQMHISRLLAATLIKLRDAIDAHPPRHNPADRAM